MSANETPEPAETTPAIGHKLFRQGSYVGYDLRLTLLISGPGQLCANLASTNVDKNGTANLNSLLVMDTKINKTGPWEISSDEDKSSAACVVYLDEFPAKQLELFAQLARTLTIEAWAENNSVRIEYSFKNGKTVYGHTKPVRWWSSETKFQDVSYSEFVRIHGEAD